MPAARKKAAAAAPVSEAAPAPEAAPDATPKAKKRQDTVASIFHDAQTSKAAHTKCIEAMHALRAKAADTAAFDEEFFNCVHCVLPIAKLEPAVEHVIDFVVSFTTIDGTKSTVDEDFVQHLCMLLLRLVSSKDKAVRWRVAQLVGSMFNALPEETEVSDELFEKVETSMRERCADKDPRVRAWAIKALFRFQNPADPDDPVVSELIRLMSEDGDKGVRMAAESTVAPSRATIRAILDRIRDVSPEVRLHTLEVITDKVEMRWLSISQRVQLIDSALRDKTPAVVDKCAELIVCWLHKSCSDDVLELMRKLDSVTNERVARLVLRTLLTHKKLSTLSSAPPAQLVIDAAAKWWAGPTASKLTDGTKAADGTEVEPTTAEAALCLRAYVEAGGAETLRPHLDEAKESMAGKGGRGRPRKRKDEDGREADADELLEPELLDVCSALQLAASLCASGQAGDEDSAPSRHCSVTQNTAALCHLAHAAVGCGTSNEAGLTALAGLCRELLTNLETPDEALAPLFAALKIADPSAHTSPQDFQDSIMGLISDVADGDDDEGDGENDADERHDVMQRMLLEQQLCALGDESNERLQMEDFEGMEKVAAQAKAIEEQISQLRGAQGSPTSEIEFKRTARALKLTVQLLQMSTVVLADFQLEDLKERAAAALASPQFELREIAVTCYGLLGHTSPELATKLLPLLIGAARIDQPAVRLAALRASLDVLLIHSPAAVLPNATLAERPEHKERDGANAVEHEGEGEEGGQEGEGGAVVGGEDGEHSAVAKARAKALKAKAMFDAAVEDGAPSPSFEDEAAYAVGGLILPLLSDRSGSLRKTAALGLSKLMHTRALRSSSLLARLLHVFCEANEADHASADAATRLEMAELTQSLQIFFAAAGRTALASALLPALRMGFQAGTADDESDDDDNDDDDDDAYVSPRGRGRGAKSHLDGLCSFVLGLTRPGGDEPLPTEPEALALAHSVHLELAVALCCEALLCKRDAEALKHLCKGLGGIVLPACGSPSLARPLTMLSGLLTKARRMQAPPEPST